MRSIIRKIFRPKLPTLNRITIDANAILHNLGVIKQQQPGKRVIPVLKSNAYGHGIGKICKILENTNVKMLAVDSYPEAQKVYKHSSKKVLIIGETLPEIYDHFDHTRTEFVVYNKRTLEYLASLKKNICVHLFINTGMNREGIQDIHNFLDETKELRPYIHITGVCSHFASADMDSELNKQQEKRFLDALDVLDEYGIHPEWVHIANSAGVFISNHPKYTAVRAGVALYGYNVFLEDHLAFQVASHLQPALELYSKIVSLQQLKKGEPVSYNETFRAEKNTTIAVIPFGYHEGLSRRLSGMEVEVDGQYVPIVGRVCMNLCCVDIGDIDADIGDEVRIISKNPQYKNSVQAMAEQMSTIPYEVLVKLREDIRRNIIW